MLLAACVAILAGTVAAGPLGVVTVGDIDRDFDHAAVQLRLARGQAQRLSGRVGPKSPVDIKGVQQALKTEVHSLREEFDAADAAIERKDLTPTQIESKLNAVFDVRPAHAPREPRRPRSNPQQPKNFTGHDRWVLAEKGRRHPWFKAKRLPRCDNVRKPTVAHTSKKDKSTAPHHIVGPHDIKPMARSLQKESLLQSASFRGGGRRRVAQGEPSLSLPGAGGTQQLADNGMSTTGSVNDVAPNTEVFKDGYSEVGCYADSMPEFADKFGDNADKYRSQHSGISVVWYKQHVLDDKQNPMWPQECYTFCRTVPHMVYFGIMDGGACYCTPYFKPMAGASVSCDNPCPGNPTTMCGGKGTSSIFEMHWCNNAGADLKEAATGAGEVLEFFEKEAWTLDKAAAMLNAAGAGLQKVAGLGGDPISGDWAQAAKMAAGEFENTLKDGECFQAFSSLQGYYKSSESTFSTDLSKAENLKKADDEIFELKTLSEKVFGCAKTAERKNIAAFPWWDDSDFNQADHLAEAQLISQTYYPLQYGLNPTTTLTDDDVTMSTCGGETIGSPMSLWFAECAAACERTVFPDKCIGFQHYATAGPGGADEFPPLCILFKEFSSLVEHKCPDATWPAMLQENKSVSGMEGDVNCFDVKVGTLFSGQTCGRAYGDAFSACPEECDHAKSFDVSAGCFIRYAELATGGMPSLDSKMNAKCFGGPTNTPGGSQSGPTAERAEPDYTASIKFGAAEGKTTTLWTTE